MSARKANHDATPSTRATIGQLCVGVLKCYEMTPGQKVSIEELGDVTIDDAEQVEVKFYKDRLTDGHPNFWKTLKNWVDDDYDAAPYASLVLHTTQIFADGAKLAEWNESDVDGRLEILKVIHANFTERLEKAQNQDKKRQPSSVYKLQEYILDVSREEKLKSVVEKFVIETGSPELSDLAKEIMDQRIVGVPQSQKKNYLEALLGFVFRPLNEGAERWEITQEVFATKNIELTSLYHKDTRIFLKKPVRNLKQLTDKQMNIPEDALFVQKIQDIDYGEDVTMEAKVAHFEAQRMIDDMFSSYQVSQERMDDYVDEVLDQFGPKYRKASRGCKDVIADSQDFYDDCHSDAPPPFGVFENLGRRFRNGVLHMQMDVEYRDLKWKLKP